MTHTSKTHRYDNDEDLWVAQDPAYPHFMATVKVPEESLPLGPHIWTFYNDSKSCSLSPVYSREVTLSSCHNGEFTCRDGGCVATEERCDRKQDCLDGSDEAGCKIVNFPVGYNKFLTPSPPSGGNLNVDISVTINEILKIDEVEGEFIVQVSTKREWFDRQLTYQNLKNDQYLDELSNEEKTFIWWPYLIFQNIANDEKWKTVGESLIDKWIVERNGTYYRDPLQTNNIPLYSGSENKILVTKTHYSEFICVFDLTWYPFDTQSCSLRMYCESDLTALSPKNLEYNGPKELAQYFVKSLRFCPMVLHGKDGISVDVTLGRPLVNNILTIFIPTIFLIMISHVSKIFEENHKDMVVMVSLTVILVLASL